MNRLRLGAVLHFIIAIGHVACLFSLDEAFEAYGIREIMHQMVSGHVPFVWQDFMPSLPQATSVACL